MTIRTFLKEFGTNEICKQHFIDQRNKTGITCKKCNEQVHYWLAGKEQWQCKNCKFRTTIKSGTIMEDSKMSYLRWFEVISFMSFTKKGMSACEMQRQLGHSRYESIWRLMHKVRTAMGNRDAIYQLTDMVEMDEGYFRIDASNKKSKAGKGSTRVNNTAVMAESTPIEDIETGKISSHCRYFKMQVLETHKAASIMDVVEENVADTTILFSDKSTTYLSMENIVEAHMMYKSSKETTVTTLRWVHIAIGNARRTFDGIYHHMKQKYLQNYLNEFCYKLNRRYFGEKLFNRVLVALAQKV
jgi:ISXO2-like transposase domain